MKFFIKDILSKCDQILGVPADLATFTEEVLNEKLHFLCSDFFDNSLRENCC